MYSELSNELYEKFGSFEKHLVEHEYADTVAFKAYICGFNEGMKFLLSRVVTA